MGFYFIMYILKLCTKCNEEKLLDEFRKDNLSSFGRYNQCKECVSNYFKLHREKNKESYKNRYALDSAIAKSKYKAGIKRKVVDKVKKREYNAAYKRARVANDPDFRMRCNIRSLIKVVIKKQGYTKKSKAFDILGCEYEEFKKYFESLFKPGMTWDNHGEWHIDHIYPVSKAKNEKHLIELNHYTNLQPLWAKENLMKGNKILL